jgi:hypothetical protein
LTLIDATADFEAAPLCPSRALAGSMSKPGQDIVTAAITSNVAQYATGHRSGYA